VAEAEQSSETQSEVAAAPAAGLGVRAPSARAGTRAAGALALQRAAGNAATAALIARRNVPAAAGSVRTPAIQREGEDVKSREGILDGTHIKSFADAAGFLNDRASKLEQERALILSDTVECPASLFNTAAAGRTLAVTCQAGGQGDIDETTYEQVDAWYLQACKAMDAGENARAIVAAGKAQEIKLKFLQAQATIDNAQLKVADKRAAAFAKSDDSTLSSIWSWGTMLLDSSLSIKPVIEGTTAMQNELANIAHGASAQGGPNVGKIEVGYKVPEAGKFLKFVELAEKINTAIAVIQSVTAMADLLAAGKSASEKAKGDIKASVALVSSVGTLIGASAGVSLMLNLYIGPMTDKCLEALSKLEDLVKKGNRDLIERGDYDHVAWDQEAGKPDGRALFNFMLTVREASSAEEVPSPVPKAVGDYFVDQKGDIDKATTGGDEKDALPTTGWWLWEKVDQKKIATWVFGHKQLLWETFYGSIVPNSKK
jgi:hypothetical protein